MEKQSPVDTFFELVSKGILWIPVCIFIVFFLVYGIKRAPEKKSVTATSLIISPTGGIGQIIDAKKNTSKKTFDLDGPMICELQVKDASVSAQIKNKNLYVEIVQRTGKEFLLVKDDCYYQWEKGTYTGVKKCGISQYRTILEQLLSTGIFQMDSLIDMAFKTKNTPQIGGLDVNQIKGVMNACRKEAIKNGAFFDVPSSVRFEKK